MTIPSHTLAEQSPAVDNEVQAPLNPYRPQAPAAGSLFVGRRAAFSWLQDALSTDRPEQPLILSGPPGTGKTSLVKQMVGRETYCVWYLSVQGVADGDPEQFLWALVQRLSDLLKQQGEPVPFVTLGALSRAPAATFKEKLLHPLRQQCGGKPLVLALDDADLLFAGPTAPALRQVLYEVVQGEEDHFRLLLACEGRPSEDDVAPFAAPLVHTLGPLEPEAALTLLRRPVPYRVYDEVAEYILAYTECLPARLQQVGHQLFERWQQQPGRQLMVADAVLVARREQVERRRQKRLPEGLTLTGAAEPSRHSRPTMRWALALLLLLLGLLSAGFFLAEPLNLPWNGADLLAAVIEPPATPTLRPAASPVAVAALTTATPSRQPATRPATAPGAALVAAAPAAGTATATATASATFLPSATPTPRPVLPPTSSALPLRVKRPADNMMMHLIASGTFTMGAVSDPWFAPHETPAHPVTLDSFYMDVYEVTVAQYAEFLNSLGGYEGACAGFNCVLTAGEVALSHLLVETLPDGEVRFQAEADFETYPINNVTWYGAVAYCEAVEARLPTEAEWEYAAKGGDTRRFPWGNELPDSSRAVFDSPQGFADLRPVDALPGGTSPFGLFAMAGNVWEWVADWYDAFYYVTSPTSNPPGPEEGTFRVVRGGGWPARVGPDQIRVTHRHRLLPDTANPDVGFRCARPAPGSPDPPGN